MARKNPVWQRHHMHYPGDDPGERTVMIRKGVHAAITIIRRFNMLTKDEVEAISYECMRKLNVGGLNAEMGRNPKAADDKKV